MAYPPFCVASSALLAYAGLVRKRDPVGKALLASGLLSLAHHSRLDGEWYRKDFLRSADLLAAVLLGVVATLSHPRSWEWWCASLYASLTLLSLHTLRPHEKSPVSSSLLHASCHVAVAIALLSLRA